MRLTSGIMDSTALLYRHEAVGVGPQPLAYFCLSLDFMNVYYQIRSSQLDRSIKGLKEHFRKNSSSSGVPYSPAIPNKRKDTPTKKPIKRPGELPLTIYVAEESQSYLCPLWGEQYKPSGAHVCGYLAPRDTG